MSALALLTMLLLTVGYLYGNILGESVTQRPIHVTVSMKETGGLFEGSGVAYRGVRIGKVDSIRLDGNGASARISIDPGTRIPVDSTAAVRTLSPAGEQFLDFQPSSSAGPYLQSGSNVAASRTKSPTSVASTLSAVDRLMSEVDDKDLATVLDELHAALADPDDLGRIVTSGSKVLRTLDANWPATLRLAQNGQTVLTTADDTSDEFRTFASSAKDLAASLKAYDPKLRTILDDTPAQVDQMRQFTSVLSLKLPAVLKDFDSLTGILADRDPHLRELLKTFPAGLGSLAGTVKNGRIQTEMLVSPGDVCSYGVKEESPKTDLRNPVVSGRACTADFTGGQRSSQHVPGPTR
jgi:phospholipid/cholesterol/gamma-HCH transport system substrate-binding protein